MSVLLRKAVPLSPHTLALFRFDGAKEVSFIFQRGSSSSGVTPGITQLLQAGLHLGALPRQQGSPVRSVDTGGTSAPSQVRD